MTEDPGVMMGTILGSCVAACMRDPVAGVGGMNHFLLPGERETTGEGPQALRYGVQSMELLLNALYRMGARRERLQVKLFGGARLSDHLSDVGQQNAAFAERFLASEGITMTGGSLRGDQARRIQFWPVSGRVRQMALVDPNRQVQVFEAERAKPVPRAHGCGRRRSGAVLMNLAVKHEDPAVDRAMGEVLEAVSRETDQLHLAAVRLQVMAGELIDRARLEPHDPLIEEAQALDALAQKLDALSGFLQRLAAAAARTPLALDIAEAIGPVFLADLAKRLCREHPSEDDLFAPSGDFELF